MPQRITEMPDDKAALVKMGIGATGAVFYGLTLNEWVALATLVYLAMQIGLLLPKYWKLISAWVKERQQ